MSFDATAKGNPREYMMMMNIRTNLIFLETESLAYIFVADSMGLSSSKFVQWAPNTHLCCNRVLTKNGFWRQIAAQGHSFCNQLPADEG